MTADNSFYRRNTLPTARPGSGRTTRTMQERFSNFFTDERSLVPPELSSEFAETFASILAGGPPKTIMHALFLTREEPTTIEGVAALAGKPTYEVDGMLAMLVDRDWVIRFSENGLEKYLLRSPGEPEQLAGEI